MRSWVLAAIFIIALLSCGLASAGQRGELYCTSCGYKQALAIGGTKKSPSLTIYCPQCKKFSRMAFASWEQATKSEEFVCPICSSKKAFVYRGQSGISCPRCGRKTTKFKTMLYVD